jgi:aspartate 1-decarboxylase
MTYGQFTIEELKYHSPTVVIVDAKNQLLEVRNYASGEVREEV